MSNMYPISITEPFDEKDLANKNTIVPYKVKDLIMCESIIMGTGKPFSWILMRPFSGNQSIATAFKRHGDSLNMVYQNKQDIHWYSNIRPEHVFYVKKELRKSKKRRKKNLMEIMDYNIEMLRKSMNMKRSFWDKLLSRNKPENDIPDDYFKNFVFIEFPCEQDEYRNLVFL